jgi:hypothetical protein
MPHCLSKFDKTSFCYLRISHFLMRCLITVRAERKSGPKCGARERSGRVARLSGATEPSESLENSPENKENNKVKSGET